MGGLDFPSVFSGVSWPDKTFLQLRRRRRASNRKKKMMMMSKEKIERREKTLLFHQKKKKTLLFEREENGRIGSEGEERRNGIQGEASSCLCL